MLVRILLLLPRKFQPRSLHFASKILVAQQRGKLPFLAERKSKVGLPHKFCRAWKFPLEFVSCRFELTDAVAGKELPLLARNFRTCSGDFRMFTAFYGNFHRCEG
jgi:hypothetical protein